MSTTQPAGREDAGEAPAAAPAEAAGAAESGVEVVTLGESMVTFLPSRPGRLADVPSFDRAIGGAESNVACVLAAAGHAARWVSRVGADGFGDHLVEAIAAYGVDTSRVRRDPGRPTGIYFRTAGERGGAGHEVAYYRSGSAASAMAADTVDTAALAAGRILHLTGITAALSASCRALLGELTAPRPGRPLISFDVNHRPGLWRGPGEGRVLRELAGGADLVFVGEDEAEEVWGVRGGPGAVRAALPEPPVLVVKQGARGATVFARPPGEDPPYEKADTVLFLPAPRVEVVATTGAGDAFAAGFLSASLRGLGLRERLRHGQLCAAAALTVPGDLAPPPDRGHADRLAALDEAEWGRLRLGPGWTRTAAGTEEATP
ncbi:carbohydrate kinase [Streptomyces albus]|uniref:Carbohydrate kinase n=2 Tax=Streptomyces TaxID=1883 RepID=A0A0B5EW93_STRA4|nr:carbohydrate kinase [Streptomyces albus]AOU81408.1 carbohydrate kinase [Streptomyces albus]AYN37101.1 carbohydrate kinase [Streptomyces albus]